MEVDALLDIQGNRASVLTVKPVTNHPQTWTHLVDRVLVREVFYRRTGRRVVRDSQATSLKAGGVLNATQLSQLSLLRLRRGTDYDAQTRNRLREILGQDFRDEVWKVDTHPWSTVELQQFLVVRVGAHVERGAWAYWKTEFGLSAQDISDIENRNTVFNPRYTVIQRKGVFNAA